MSRRVQLMTVSLDDYTEQQVVESMLSALDVGRGGWVVTLNLDHLRQICQEPELARLVQQADIIVADGMPLVWASWLKGSPLPERVAGSDLIHTLTAAAARNGASVFLLGGSNDTADRSGAVLQRQCPGIDIVGTLCPPLGFENDPAYMKQLEARLLESQPQIVYVCLGFPKQELLIERLRQILPRTWFVGLGITFSFVSKDLSRAPQWMQKCGLEWLHRTMQEPGRLFPRYFLRGMPFAARLLGHALRARWSV